MSALVLGKRGDNLKRHLGGKVAGILFLLVLLLTFQPPPAGGAANPGNGPQVTEQETWVLSQIKEGREADLGKKYVGEDNKRRLNAGFLKKLLNGDFKDLPIPHQGVKIANAVIIDGPLDLKDLEVDYPLSLSHCVFQDPVNFEKSNFKKDLKFIGSRFLQNANFKGIKIDGSVFCDSTFFEGESLWEDAKIGERFQAEGAQFRSKEGKADFHFMKVGTEACFSSGKFYGPVDFGLANIGVRLNLFDAEFFHEEKTADFLALVVGQYALLKEARFHGPVNFVIAQIGLQLFADKAEFFHKEKPVNLSLIKVGNTLAFRGAHFHGPLKTEFAEIGLNIRATGVRLHDANLSKMKVGNKVFLDEATILGDLDVSYGNFTDLEISGMSKDKAPGGENTCNLNKLNLKGIQVQRDLTIANASIGELLASNVQVKGPAYFRNLDIKTLADFRHSSFQAMDFQKVAWPPLKKEKGKNVREVCLSEMTYNSISIDKPEDKDHGSDYTEADFTAIRNFVEDSPFNTQTYVQLEAFFRRIGKEDWANKVYIRMHDRDLEENYHVADPVRWLEWLLWGRLAGYGKKPFRVFFISLALIILGACLFDPEYLMDDKTSTEGSLYKSVLLRFFLSLDRFLPIELGLAKSWDAKATRFPIWFYFYLQQILGWILIPIALASIYTQIK